MSDTWYAEEGLDTRWECNTPFRDWIHDEHVAVGLDANRTAVLDTRLECVIIIGCNNSIERNNSNKGVIIC